MFFSPQHCCNKILQPWENFTAHSTQHTAHSTQHTAHSTQHTAHSTLNFKPSKLTVIIVAMLFFNAFVFKAQAQQQTADSALVVTDTSVSTVNNVVVTDSSGNTTLFAGGEQSGFSGMVGVGTSTPAVKLHVYDDNKANFRLSQRMNNSNSNRWAAGVQHSTQRMTNHNNGLTQGNGQHLFGQQIINSNGQPIENFNIDFLDSPTDDGIFAPGTVLISTSTSSSTAGGSYTSSGAMVNSLSQAPHDNSNCVLTAQNPALAYATTNYGWYVPNCTNNTYSGNIMAMYLDPDVFALNVRTVINGEFVVNDNNGNELLKLHQADQTLYAREIKVQATPFPADFVFEKDYKLMGLHELENYVNANHHLPEIPSADEQKKDGVNVADMQNKLLQKIEELTLIVIEQNKRIDELEKQAKH